MNWLVVYIAAPLASFGEEPGNARRGSADRPTRSALMGLAGAALGIERADGPGQRALGASFLTATRTLAAGTPLTDFHTFQSLPASAGPAATRADALARREDLETSITRREYRADGHWQAAFVEREGATLALADLANALRAPRFALWAGRKSCPLSHPLVPDIIAADTAPQAFAAHAKTLGLATRRPTTVALDARLPGAPPTNAGRRHRRRDDPGDRLRWHFSARDELVFTMEAS